MKQKRGSSRVRSQSCHNGGRDKHPQEDAEEWSLDASLETGLERTAFRLKSEPRHYCQEMQTLDTKFDSNVVINSRIKQIKIRQTLEKKNKVV